MTSRRTRAFPLMLLLLGAVLVTAAIFALLRYGSVGGWEVSPCRARPCHAPARHLHDFRGRGSAGRADVLVSRATGEWRIIASQPQPHPPCPHPQRLGGCRGYLPDLSARVGLVSGLRGRRRTRRSRKRHVLRRPVCRRQGAAEDGRPRRCDRAPVPASPGPHSTRVPDRSLHGE